MANATTQAKNAAISARILAAHASGMTEAQAVDSVLGAGTFDAIASDLFDQLTK